MKGRPMQTQTCVTFRRRQAALAGLVAALALALPPAAFADASRCYSIQNQDSRNYCLATARGEKSYCYSIREQDQKNLCLAQTGGGKSYCYSIRSHDLKNQCLAVVR